MQIFTEYSETFYNSTCGQKSQPYEIETIWYDDMKRKAHKLNSNMWFL